jgi:S-DNA-T family DNA segregation ATPase FtsK/SpoIIIE
MPKKQTPPNQNREGVAALAETIATTFAGFGIPITVVEAIEGYREFFVAIRPTEQVRMKAIQSYRDDLRYALGTDAVEIEAPIPNHKLVGITVAKQGVPPPVPWSKDLTTKAGAAGPLSVPLGIDARNEPVMLDLASLPHLLIGGNVGTGKSNLLHLITTSLLTRHSADTLRFLMLDPKRVELTLYQDIPHLLTPPITDTKKSVLALKWAVKEMHRRYDVLQSAHIGSIKSYHEAQRTRRRTLEPLPFIVILVDELADLMHTYRKELEASIISLAQMGRGVGIHLVLATQRPSSSVLTSDLKAILPSRIAFATSSYVDSRQILDCNGAEKLAGPGDLLFLPYHESKSRRIQSYYINETVVEAVVKPLRTEDSEDPLRLDPYLNAPITKEEFTDEQYARAVAAVREAGKASTSYLQRKLKLGYSRAAALMDLLEDRGIIGPQDGAHPRRVYEE